MLLATCADVIKLWDFSSSPYDLSLIRSIRPHNAPINCLTWNHNNNVVASCSDDGRAVIVSSEGNVLDTISPSDKEPLKSLAFHNGRSRYLAAGGGSSLVYVWDMKKVAMIRTLQGHKGQINCCKFDPLDENLASGADDGRILVHQIRASELVCEVSTSTKHPVKALVYSPQDSNRLAFAAGDGRVSLVDIHSSRIRSSFQEHTMAATSLAFSAKNPSLLVSAGMDKKVVFYDVKQKKCIKTIFVSAPVQCLAFHWNGQALAVGTSSGDIYAYDLKSPNAPVVSHQDVHAPFPVYGMAFQNKPRDAASNVKKSRTSFADSIAPLPSISTIKNETADILPSGPEPTSSFPPPDPSFQSCPQPSPLNPDCQPTAFPKSDTQTENKSTSSKSEQELQRPNLDPDEDKDPPRPRERPTLHNRSHSDPKGTSRFTGQPLGEVSPARRRSTSGGERDSRMASGAVTPQNFHSPRFGMDASTFSDFGTLTADGATSKSNAFDKLLLGSILEEQMGAFRAGIQSDVKNLHLDMLRQFQIQQESIDRTLKKHSEQMEAIVKENQDLRAQLKELKRIY